MQCYLLRDNTLSPAMLIKYIQGLLLRSVRGGGAHFAELSFPSWATVLIYTHRWALATSGHLSLIKFKIQFLFSLAIFQYSQRPPVAHAVALDDTHIELLRRAGVLFE